MAINPLTDTDCAECDRDLKEMAEVLGYLEKCERCGLPTEELVSRAQAVRQVAAAIKAEFFPDRP